jgi:hypothetical protein
VRSYREAGCLPYVEGDKKATRAECANGICLRQKPCPLISVVLGLFLLPCSMPFIIFVTGHPAKRVTQSKVGMDRIILYRRNGTGSPFLLSADEFLLRNLKGLVDEGN